MRLNFTRKFLLLALGFSLSLPVMAGGGGGGGGCGPSNSCPGPSLTLNTVYSYDNSGCGANSDCTDCFILGDCANICSNPPEHNEDCNSSIMGKLCSIEGAFCGSPENTSWAQFCPTVSGSYNFSVSSVSCSGGGASLQYGIYAAGVNCTNNTQAGLLDCDNGTVANTTYTESLVAGQCYLIVFDGNAGASCSWNFQITGPPLPVYLTGYNLVATEQGVRVDWSTSKEENSKNFRIVRRYDDMTRTEGMSADESYNKLKVEHMILVPAAVRAESYTAYSYLDKQVSAPGVYIYELYEEDQDGNLRYLGTDRIYVGAPQQTIVANVSMASQPGIYNLSFDLAFEDRVQLTTWGLDGKAIRNLDLGFMSAGKHTQEVDLSWLPSGVYMYELKAGSKSFAGKLVKP